MIEGFFDEIDIMRSLAKPRKITIQGSDGQVYTFLGKPKDDLRKDARLMDFNSIINKLLKANSESRRRQLRKILSDFSGSVLTLPSRYSHLWCSNS
jgi:serine/threonine-protein kinase ATR